MYLVSKLTRANARQLEIRLVNESGGLKRVIWTFPAEVPASDPPQISYKAGVSSEEAASAPRLMFITDSGTLGLIDVPFPLGTRKRMARRRSEF